MQQQLLRQHIAATFRGSSSPFIFYANEHIEVSLSFGIQARTQINDFELGSLVPCRNPANLA
jgi:hypothetical protein